jgi:subtilisin family serine protease
MASSSHGADPGAVHHLHFKERSGGHALLIETNEARKTGEPWTLTVSESSHDHYELGHRIVLRVEEGTNATALADAHGLKISRTVGSNLFILEARDSKTAIQVAEALAEAPGVLEAYPIMRRPYGHRNAYATGPNDTYYTNQWHLENRGADGNLAGPDLDVPAAWPVAAGSGVLVAVADVGVQLDHPDLTNRLSGGPHFNFFQSNSNGGPYAADADHGTAVAGLVAAERDNHRGVSGVAPQSKLASWVVFGTSGGSEVIADDEQLMDMFQYSSNRVSVQNHSWASGTIELSPLDSLSDAGISNAVTRGRAGKGEVLVRAAGNSRDQDSNANDDGFANDPRQIAVAAVRKDNRACSYSDPGACVLVAAPSGDVIDTNNDGIPDAIDPAAPDVLTTDRTGSDGYSAGPGDLADYAGFDGTSASSPQVAGVAALILSANTNLTWRDVQQILLLSARHYDFADPDLHTNGAGLRFSHNVGFGIPDSGFAVQMARAWSNRPALKQTSLQNTTTVPIPDDSLRVICAATGLPASLTSIHCLPSQGPHPDDPTATLPLVYVGQANSDLTVDLHGKGALIQRGVSFFYEKIERAARAGAAFAVIFNNTGSNAIQAMGATGYVPIPAVSIGRTDGEALRDFIANHPDTTARLQLNPAVYRFTVTSNYICEHVGVRLKTTHTSRSDVRVTLVSPMRTRSILQAINSDSASGPADWTYWSVQHFFESSAGEWRVEVSDERNTLIGTTPATGSATFVQLLVEGVPIVDTDHDGLDDNWELQRFGNLSSGPKDDPDGDGFNNAREQVMGTNPLLPNSPFKLDFAQLQPGYWRLSWPARDNTAYAILSGSNVALPFTTLTNIPGRLPVSEYVVRPLTNQFYRVVFTP